MKIFCFQSPKCLIPKSFCHKMCEQNQTSDTGQNVNQPKALTSNQSLLWLSETNSLTFTPSSHELCRGENVSRVWNSLSRISYLLFFTGSTKDTTTINVCWRTQTRSVRPYLCILMIILPPYLWLFSPLTWLDESKSQKLCSNVKLDRYKAFYVRKWLCQNLKLFLSQFLIRQ